MFIRRALAFALLALFLVATPGCAGVSFFVASRPPLGNVETKAVAAAVSQAAGEPADLLTPACDQAGVMNQLAMSRPSGKLERQRNLSSLVKLKRHKGEHPWDLQIMAEGRVNKRQVAEARGVAPYYLAELNKLSFKGAYRRSYSLDGTPAMVEVVEFQTAEDALNFQTFAIGMGCQFANGAFEVDVPQSIGLQVRSNPTTIVEQVSFVRGSRRYYAQVCMTPDYQFHPDTVEAAKRLASVAQ
jgi:hypothetical protein